MFGSLAFAISWMTPLTIGHDVALQWVQRDGIDGFALEQRH